MSKKPLINFIQSDNEDSNTP